MKFWKAAWEGRCRLNPGGSQGLVKCEPDWCWDPPSFPDFDLWIALEGSGVLRLRDQELPVTPGFSICFPPGDWGVHAEHDPKQPLQVFFCHFTLDQARGLTLPAPPKPNPVILHADPLLWSTVRELVRCLDNRQASGLRENLLWQLLLRREQAAPAVDSSPEERVRVLIRQIRESPAQARCIDDLAAEAAMSTGHFRRVFRRITGKSPMEFMLDCRIGRAAYYLAETRLPINRVAAVVGYSDVYFFSRQFKERTGLSPSAFRKDR